MGGPPAVGWNSSQSTTWNSILLFRATNRTRRRGVGGKIQWRLVSLQTNMKEEEEEEGGGDDLRVYPPMTAGRRDSLKEAEVRVGMRRV